MFFNFEEEKKKEMHDTVELFKFSWSVGFLLIGGDVILWMREFCTFDKKTKSLTFVFVENATNEYHENGAITKYIIIPPYFVT